MKERILKVASSLFYKYGIRTVTMDDIARELGISKKTIYHHFRDKNEIVNDIIEEVIKSARMNVQCLRQESKDPVEEAVNSVKLLRQKFTTLKHKILSDLKKYYPEVWSKLMKYEYDYRLNEIRTNLEEGVKRGFYRPEINVEIMALLRLKQFELGLDPDVFPPDKFSYLTVQEELADHFMHGLLSEEGYQVYYQYIKKQQVENNNL